MLANVRRYVALAQSRGGARFCTRDAMQGYDDVLFVLALAKTVTPEGSAPRERGQAAPRNGFCPAASAVKPGR
jgi:hypothetical protein